MSKRSISNESDLRRKEAFENVLPAIVDSYLTSNKFKDVKDVASWIKEVLYGNLSGGKLGRGLTTVMTYEMLEKPEKITDESLHLSRVMGWCVEMFQSFMLMLDDIMDGSVTRRGKPCWYRLPNVGLGAINDSILLNSSRNEILRTHFGHMPQYAVILDLFHQNMLLTSIGQHLDYSMAHRNKEDYSLFTMDQYNAIVKYKTSYYTFVLPVCLGVIITSSGSKKIFSKVEEICFKIGRIFQMQDDFIDVFGSESVTGKAGTDIQEGKCTWLAVTTLEQCNDSQRKLFKSCYGSSDPANVAKIKGLYEQLNLPKLYKHEETTRMHEVVEMARSFDSPNETQLFLKIVDSIHNRNK